MQKRGDVLLSILASITVLVSIIGLVHSCQNNKPLTESGGLILDEDAQPYDPSADLVADNVNGIAIPGYGDIYFPADETTVQLTLYNPEKNNCLFRFELYIDDNTEPIASTDLIEAGKAVESITLSHPLQAGEYTLGIKVLPYTVENYTALNNALVRAKLYVIDG